MQCEEKMPTYAQLKRECINADTNPRAGEEQGQAGGRQCPSFSSSSNEPATLLEAQYFCSLHVCLSWLH